jgi:hypothetical protein
MAKAQTVIVKRDNGGSTMIVGHTERKDLVRKIKKVLKAEGGWVSRVHLKPKDVDGGHFVGGEIVCGSFKTFLHELAHAQSSMRNCSHRYGSCSCKHDENFHRKAFRLYAEWLSTADAKIAREAEYRYHANTAGKVAKEFKKRAEFLRWKRANREVKAEARLEVDIEAKEAARRLNEENARKAFERLIEWNRTKPADWSTRNETPIYWYGANSMNNFGGTVDWRPVTKGMKMYVYTDGRVRNKAKKVVLELPTEFVLQVVSVRTNGQEVNVD